MNSILLVAVAVVALGGAALVGYGVGSRGTDSVPEEPIVVSKSRGTSMIRLDDGSSVYRASVRYSIRGATEEAATFSDRPCFLRATVGQPLPAECR